MREKARQIKVQEKLKQMSDVTWYEDFLSMLPNGIVNAKTAGRQWNELKSEEKLLIKIKRFVFLIIRLYFYLIRG